MKDQLQRNILLLNIFSFFRFFAFWQPIEQLYLYSIGGNEEVMGVGLAIWMLAQFAFEIPSGYISDRLGKKKVFYIAQAARILALLIIAIPQTIPSYYVGILLFGMSMAFISGSDKALLHDTLVDLKREKEYKKIAGRMDGLAIVGMMLSGFMAIAIAKLGYPNSYLLSIVSPILVTGIIWLMYEPKHHMREVLHNPVRDMFVVLKSLMGTKVLQLLILLAATMELVKRVNMDFGQAFLFSFITSATVVSFVWVLGGASRAISNFIAHRVERYRWTLVFVTFAVFLAMAFGPRSLAPFLYVLVFLPINVVILEAEEAVQKVASSHLRATTLSGMNMFITLIETIPLVALGWLMADRGAVFGFQVASSILTVFVVILFIGTILYRQKTHSAVLE